MKFVVMLHDTETNKCRIGEAATGGKSPAPLAARVFFAGQLVPPSDGVIVIAGVAVEGTALLDLLEAGYAVQVRDVHWRPVE